MTNLDSIFKNQRHHFVHKCPYSQGYGFYSNHVLMWEMDHKEGWAPKNWCFWIVVLEKTLESPLDCKKIKPVNPKGDQPWILIGRTVVEAPILWPLNSKSQLIGKNPDAGQDWRQKEKRATEDEMVGWHHQLRVWASSGRWWRTGKPGVLQSMGLQRVRHNLATEQQQILANWEYYLIGEKYSGGKIVSLQLLSVFIFLCEARRGRLREIWFP